MTKTSEAFGEWVRSHRKGKFLTRLELARRAGVDPSYITLIERVGYIPRHDKVERLGEALGCQGATCAVAGYVPPNVSVPELLAALDLIGKDSATLQTAISTTQQKRWCA